jgi:hypothetical protein
MTSSRFVRQSHKHLQRDSNGEELGFSDGLREGQL